MNFKIKIQIKTSNRQVECLFICCLNIDLLGMNSKTLSLCCRCVTMVSVLKLKMNRKEENFVSLTKYTHSGDLTRLSRCSVENLADVFETIQLVQYFDPAKCYCKQNVVRHSVICINE